MHAPHRGGATARSGCSATSTGIAPTTPDDQVELLPAVQRHVAFLVLPGGNLDPGGFGQPTPPMLSPLKRRRLAPVEFPDLPNQLDPFAALAGR